MAMTVSVLGAIMESYFSNWMFGFNDFSKWIFGFTDVQTSITVFKNMNLNCKRTPKADQSSSIKSSLVLALALIIPFLFKYSLVTFKNWNVKRT